MTLYLNADKGQFSYNKKDYLLRAAKRVGIDAKDIQNAEGEIEYLLNIQPCDIKRGSHWTGLWHIDVSLDSHFPQHYVNNELIYTQDDDVINHDIDKLIEAHEGLTCAATEGYMNALNKPPYSNTNLALLGYGSLFSTWDMNFGKYLSKYPADELFYREADRIFTLLNPNKPRVIKCNIEEIDNLKHSMSGESRHLSDRQEIIKRCKQ
ncbi:MAG: hypothetical protein BWY19_01084 [bacterium ADurb.Bin212]|jgi:hypothetical protein|nr:MAG: hypothetical protein BWY19_01084 [bacterium ADurb.Bin212]